MTLTNLLTGLKSRLNIFGQASLNPSFMQIWAILAFVVFTYPIIWLASVSIKQNWEIYREPLSLISSSPTLDAYLELFRTTPFLTYTFNSVVYSSLGALVAIGFGIVTAYGFSRHKFPMRNNLMIIILAAQLMPGLITAIPTYLLMLKLGLLDTEFGLILIYGALSIPFAIWVMKGHFDSIPFEIDDSARMDGASKLRTLFQIHLPLLLPGLSSLFLILFIQKWSEFALASVLLRDPDKYPLSVGTYLLLGADESDFRLMAAASLVNIIPILILFVFLQRYLVAGLTKGAVK